MFDPSEIDYLFKTREEWERFQRGLKVDVPVWNIEGTKLGARFEEHVKRERATCAPIDETLDEQ